LIFEREQRSTGGRGNFGVWILGIGKQILEGRPGAAPGEVLAAGNEIVLACGERALSVTLLQAEGRKPLGAGAFSRGERVVPGESWA